MKQKKIVVHLQTEIEGKNKDWIFPYDQVGLYLAKIREFFGFSQQDIANEMGVSVPRLSAVERSIKIPKILWLTQFLAATGHKFKIEIK